jgi:hypothetical protein
MLRWLSTVTSPNKNIASPVPVGTFTSTGDRAIVLDLTLDQVAGNGDYVAYVTRQIGGAGSHAVVGPKTTLAAAAGETAVSFQSGIVSLRTGDVLTVYVDGLGGDGSTPDVVLRIFEITALQPTTPDAAVAVDGEGRVAADLTAWDGAAVPSRRNVSCWHKD